MIKRDPGFRRDDMLNFWITKKVIPGLTRNLIITKIRIVSGLDMYVKLRSNQIFGIILFILLLSLVAYGQGQRDLVRGNLIQLSDNGAWCWYQDERAVIDTAAGKLILGYVASGSGVGGSPRSGDVDAVIYNLQTGERESFTMKQDEPVAFYCDDHNTPAFLVRPDGKYLAFYAAHFNDTSSYYRIYEHGIWGAERKFEWKKERPGGSNFQTTYSNVYHLPADGRTYNFVRGNNKSPNSMISYDQGDTWSYGGQLTRSGGVGYNNGYYKYSGNGLDRIDFIFTEYHPRDYNTSIYHGYIMDGKSYKSDGTLVDNNILDTVNITTPNNYTQVFAANTVVHSVTMTHCWNTDVQWYADGTIASVITARANSDASNPDLRFMYCRYNGSNWITSYLCKAGLKLYSSEQDYTGLAAMHPYNPNIIYVSTTYDPRDDVTNLGVHEIFKGVSEDNGTTWTWTPVTLNSVRDNLRPILPKWDENNTALLWWRGTYNSAQNFNAAVVGILDHAFETASPMVYVDAALANTTLSSGEALVTTGPDGNQGAADNQWHRRTGYGNGDTVFTSAEIGGEDAPTLRTRITVPQTGSYDIWINFWANPAADWRIKAGLAIDQLQIFRQAACKQVEAGDHNTSLVLTGAGDTYLYQAYLGRVHIDGNNTFYVFVDDHAVQTGTSGTLIGNTARTWYDGISYASLNTLAALSLSTTVIDFGLVQVDSVNCDSIVIVNEGSDTLRIASISSTNNLFTFMPENIRIAPTAADVLIINFTPQDTSTQSGFIILTHNAAGSPDTISVSGKGLGPDVTLNDFGRRPVDYALYQNYPNPFNPITTINYALPKTVHVNLKVYNLLGQEIATLVNKEMPMGINRVVWNAGAIPSGIYFYKIMAGNFQKINKMIVIK